MSLPVPARRFLATVIVAGALAIAGVFVLLGHDQRHDWSGGALPLLLVLLAATTVSEVAGIHLRHGGEVERITLYEALVVANMTLLPPAQAMAVSIGGLSAALVIKRQPLVKTLFNLGMYGASLGPAIACYHVLSAGAPLFALRNTIALAAGIGLFAGINLLLICQLIALLENRPAWTVVRESSGISVLLLLANSAAGVIGVVLYRKEPALLPVALLPVITVYLAFRSSARDVSDRERYRRLYGIGQELSSSPDLDQALPDILPRIARLFEAEAASLLFAQGAGRPFGAVFDSDGFRFGPANDPDLEAISLLGGQTTPLLARGRKAPRGWKELVAAPLIIQGRHLGVLVLGNHVATAPFSSRDTELIAPLASGLAVALRNASNLARLKEEKSKLEQILGLSSDGIVLLDGKGRIRLWNIAMAQIMGISEETAVGLPYNELLRGKDQNGTPTTLESLLTGAAPASPQATCEVLVTTAEGGERWLRCNHSLLFEGNTWTTDVVIVHDVTRIRETENLKADFVATVSHELRTPITPIKGYAELLLSRGSSLSEDKRRSMLEVISERADHMARLIEDLLLASRISSSQGDMMVAGLRTHPQDLVAAVSKAASHYLRDPGSRLEVELPDGGASVLGDALRLDQVLANLLSNAHKYSPADRPVTMRLVTADGFARVQVTDRGRGIPRDELERVFEKFHRVEDPLTMTTGGTGLGLYIARELARAMGGDIEVLSALGRGSTFTLCLPLAPAAQPPAAQPPAAQQGALASSARSNGGSRRTSN